MRHSRTTTLALIASGLIGVGAAYAAASGTEPSTRLDPSSARERAAEVFEGLPSPRGASIDGIRWEEAGGTFSSQEIEFTVHYNLACQWYRAFADGRQRAEAAQVIEEVPQWPGFAGSEVGAVARQVADEARSGRFGSAGASVVASCRDSHRREIQHARERGGRPSS